MKLSLLKQAEVSGKTVFLRVDIDVPIEVESSRQRRGEKR